jgi:hypothetical protein
MLINRKPCEIILFSNLLLTSLAILAPLAGAQQSNSDPVNLGFDSIYEGGTTESNCYGFGCKACPANAGAVACAEEQNANGGQQPAATPENKPEDDSKKQTPDGGLRVSKPADLNRDIYYRNKLEFSLDGGWLPINIPFPFDFLLSDQYELYPLKYTLVPIIGSLRWQVDGIEGPRILRGNWDFEFSGAAVAIPRGPETRYFAYIMGFRRNFVPRHSRIAPYFDGRVGLGDINAKGPDGVKYAQGQDFTFTLNMGSGLRYNFNPRYAITAGLNWMHISNANLSEHKFDPAQPDPYGVINYGINVYGPMFGLDIQLRRHQKDAE